MKKQYKKISNRKRKKFIQIFMRFILIEFLITIVFLFTFYDTSIADFQNTHTVNTQILDVKVRDGSNKLTTFYFKTPIDSYRITWKTYDKIYNPINTEDLKNRLIEEPSVTLTVLDNSKKSSILYGETTIIVDIRSESTVYYDISDYNQWQTENRAIAIIAFVVIEIVMIASFMFVIFLNKQ